MKYLAVIFGLSLSLFACKSEMMEPTDLQSVKEETELTADEYDYAAFNDLGAEANKMAVPRTSEQQAPPAPEIKPLQVMLVKSGSMRVEVDDLSKSKETLDSIVTFYGGYYQSDILHQGGDRSSYELLIRFPVNRYDEAPKAIEDLGDVTYKSIQVEDVTKEYADLALRLGHHEAYLKRYIEVLQKADSIKDILVVQERIRVLEEEVEAKKGHMRYLKHRATYSTLELQMEQYHPQVAHATSHHLGAKFSNAFIDGLQGLLGFTLGLISIWPSLIMIVMLAYFLLRYKRKKKIKLL